LLSKGLLYENCSLQEVITEQIYLLEDIVPSMGLLVRCTGQFCGYCGRFCGYRGFFFGGAKCHASLSAMVRLGWNVFQVPKRLFLGTEWRRPIECLIFIRHFLQKSPIISGSLAKIDLQLEASYGSSPPCSTNMSFCIRLLQCMVPSTGLFCRYIGLFCGCTGVFSR